MINQIDDDGDDACKALSRFTRSRDACLAGAAPVKLEREWVGLALLAQM